MTKSAFKILVVAAAEAECNGIFKCDAGAVCDVQFVDSLKGLFLRKFIRKPARRQRCDCRAVFIVELQQVC